MEGRSSRLFSNAAIDPNLSRCFANGAASVARSVRFDRLDDFRSSEPCSAVVPKVPSFMCRPARPAICAISAGGQPPRPAPVEFADPGEGDMVEVHVETHADRVGRDEIVDLAGLEHADLRVARSRAQRPENDRGAAALPADQLGKREDVAMAKATTALRGGSARHLFVAGVGQVEKRGRLTYSTLGNQPPHQRLDRVGAEEHRFLHARARAKAAR